MFRSFLRWWKGEYHLPEILGREMYQVVYQAWAGGFTVSSNMARTNAAWVSVAATLGLITTREADGSFGRTWYVTQAGIGFLNNYWENN